MNIVVSIDINSPKQKVWQVITDIKNSKNVISAIISLEVLGQPEEGLIGFKWTETRKIFGKESSETMWIVECEPEVYYTARADNCGAIYTTIVSVSSIDDITRLEMSFNATSESVFGRIIAAIMGVMMNASMKKMLLQDLNDIKKYIEKAV